MVFIAKKIPQPLDFFAKNDQSDLNSPLGRLPLGESVYFFNVGECNARANSKKKYKTDARTNAACRPTQGPVLTEDQPNLVGPCFCLGKSGPLEEPNRPWASTYLRLGYSLNLLLLPHESFYSVTTRLP